MVRIAQLVRASDCGSEGRGFESHFSPVRLSVKAAFFCLFSMSFALHFLELRCKDMLKFLNIQSIWCIILKEKRLILAHDWQSEVFNPTKVNTFFFPIAMLGLS